ncbi:WhiB family transcriptional regulator [Streptomyces sp. NBC_00243]|uniref:WhiB family transcriptional regulator n=1 Tax=Streptomyces sp. NBC_00243 TaxID=2975688 RepID=UPI002DDAC21B|nr:WhiB family transcriptional regulator [Streptomyces sp. NBC_00243]WRZ21234.1 WhiB family transcriptional regulator [Streptomyces sp. NBC_00243]
MRAYGDRFRASAGKGPAEAADAVAPATGGSWQRTAARHAEADCGAPDWGLSATCRNEDPELWFSDRTRATAIAICNSCLVLQECRVAVLHREAGLPASDRAGIAAGLTGAQRHELDKRRTRRAEVPSSPPARVPPPREEIAPCGTRAAYQRHVRKGEPPDDACRAANARGASIYRRTGSTLRSAGRPPPGEQRGPSGTVSELALRSPPDPTRPAGTAGRQWGRDADPAPVSLVLDRNPEQTHVHIRHALAPGTG